MKQLTFADLRESRCVVFDFDGTLCDSLGDILTTFREVARLHGVTDIDWSAVRIGPPLAEMIGRGIGEKTDSARVEAMATDYRRIYFACDFTASPLYPGAPDLLRKLKDAGIRLAIATNKREAATGRILAKKEIAGFFDAVFSCDRGGEPWDKPRMLRAILGAAKTSPRECVFLGDTAEDIHAGQAVGVKTVGVLYGYGTPDEIIAARPDFLCESLIDLSS